MINGNKASSEVCMVILSGVLYLISELTLREAVEFLGLPNGLLKGIFV